LNDEHFDKGGELRSVLVTAAASLVAFHNDVTKDLGYDNPLSCKMRKIARDAKLKDPSLPRSKKIIDDFNSEVGSGANV